MSGLVPCTAWGMWRVAVRRVAGLCAGLLLAACQGTLTTAEPDKESGERQPAEQQPAGQQPAQDDARERPGVPDIPAPADGAVKASPIIRLLPAALNVSEGESTTYGVVLGTDPEGVVTVTMQATAELTVRPTANECVVHLGRPRPSA